MTPFGKGAFFVPLRQMMDETPLQDTLAASGEVTVYECSRGDLLSFLDANPGLMMSFLNSVFLE
jgi:hypothetical protein